MSPGYFQKFEEMTKRAEAQRKAIKDYDVKIKEKKSHKYDVSVKKWGLIDIYKCRMKCLTELKLSLDRREALSM